MVSLYCFDKTKPEKYQSYNVIIGIVSNKKYFTFGNSTDSLKGEKYISIRFDDIYGRRYYIMEKYPK